MKEGTQTGRKPALLLLLLALLAVGLVGFGAPPAFAGNEPAFGTTEVAATNWLVGNGGGVNVYSNGDTSNITYNYSSPAVGMQWQCVELTQRLYQSKGWHSGYWSGVNSAYQIYDNASANGLVAHLNNGSYTPVPGDMIVHSPSTSDPAGHVAIVDYVSGNKVFVVEQNVATSAESSPGRASYTIGANGTLTRDQSIGLSIRGIVHSPNNTYTNASPPPPAPSPSIAANAQSTTVQGDFNGDGHTDVAVFYSYPNAQTVLWVFWGDGSGGLSAPTIAWNSGQNSWDATDIKPVVGDFNGDGKADIAAFYNYGNATTALFVFTSQGTTFSNPVSVWNSGTGNWDWNAMQVVGGDFNGDGKADIAAMYAYPDSQTAIFMFQGNGSGGFSGPTGWWNSGAGNWAGSSTKLAAGDVNHDGKTDIIAMYDYGNSNTSVFVFYSQGTAFNNSQGQWNSGAGNWIWSQSKPVSGDFNGDGRADLGVFYGYPNGQTKLWVFSANSSGGLSAPVVYWDSGVNSWDWSRIMAFSGEYNGDGNTDIGAFFAYDNNETALFLFLSNGSGFKAPSCAWDSGAGNWNGHDILIA